ncbi:hypothetical protein DIPPA_03114 [Diplonema papillatum]|nr:hypothetical protein DIPPA_03114 [Diplonema papillatum]
MAQVRFENEEGYFLEGLIEAVVDKANCELERLVAEKDTPVKGFAIRRTSLGSRPPYVELTQLNPATDFPAGLIPQKRDHGRAKVFKFDLGPSGEAGSAVRFSAATLGGDPVTWDTILESLPFMPRRDEKETGVVTPLTATSAGTFPKASVNRAHPAAAEAGEWFASGSPFTCETRARRGSPDPGEPVRQPGEKPQREKDGASPAAHPRRGPADGGFAPAPATPPQPAAAAWANPGLRASNLNFDCPSLSPASHSSALPTARGGFAEAVLVNSGWAEPRDSAFAGAGGRGMPGDGEQGSGDEGGGADDNEAVPGFAEAVARHVARLAPVHFMDLFGPDGAWAEFTFSYGGDLEIELELILSVDGHFESTPLPNLVSLPVHCRVHSLRVHTAVEIIVKNGAVTIYLIPETPVSCWSSPVNLELDVTFGRYHPYLDTQAISAFVRGLLSELLFDHILWPNAFTMPLDEVSALLRKAIDRWVVSKSEAR